jgi:hypothetical protein
LNHALPVGFSGALRRAELAAIRVERLEACERGLRLTPPETKGERTGRGVTVAIPYGSTELCPVRALRQWQQAAGITEGPVFRRIWNPPSGRNGLNTPCPESASPPSMPAPPPASSRPAQPRPASAPSPRRAATASGAAR